MVDVTADREPVADRPHLPGYGIEAGPDGLLPWSWAVSRLSAARNYWLATRDADGAPHLAAVWAVWSDGAVCFSTGGRSRKARNLAADPRCVITPEGAAESVVVRGTAHRVTAAAELDRLTAAYRSKYGSAFPDPSENPVFAVVPATVIAVIDGEPDFTHRATRWHLPPS